jgi:hypothetical protein
VNTASEFMFQMAAINYHTLTSTQTVVLEKAVEYNGETFEPGPTDHDSTIIDFNGNLMDLLPAPIVTKENVDPYRAIFQ